MPKIDEEEWKKGVFVITITDDDRDVIEDYLLTGTYEDWLKVDKRMLDLIETAKPVTDTDMIILDMIRE